LTDIEGANRLGIPTIMTLSGVTSPAEYEQSSVKATLSFSGLPELIAEWKKYL
jgi:ribonucleotide monophosphatase NagD (HAD superfamily)